MSLYSDSSFHTSTDINVLHCMPSSPVRLTILQRLCHRLAMQLSLCEDQLLEEVFTEYLQLPVFPVSLEFYATDEGGYLIEPSRSHLELWKDKKIQKTLFKWAEFSRIGYFIKSPLFSEFRFVKKLNERRSCHPENTTITYAQFRCFQAKLVRTKGHCQLKLWLSLQSLEPLSYQDYLLEKMIDFMAMNRIRREYCDLIQDLNVVTFPTNGNSVSQFRWSQVVMSQLMQRLSDYWWPRMSSEPCLESCPHRYQLNTLDCDSNQPFKDGLRFDKYAGQPFLDYLTKTLEDDVILFYHVWQDIHELLNTNLVHYEFRRTVMRLVLKYKHKVTALSSSIQPIAMTYNETIIKERLVNIMDDILVSLKRKWTSYLHKDYTSFCSCFPEDQRVLLLPSTLTSSSLEVEAKENAIVQSGRITRRRKYVKPKEITVSMADLIGSPLEALHTPQALEDFKAYLEDEYGTQSKEYVAFELWMSILVHDKMPKGRRNRHARKIFHQFLSPSANVPLNLTGKDEMLPRRPSTPTLHDIQLHAMEAFAVSLVEFLQILHGDTNTQALVSSMLSLQSGNRHHYDMPLFQTPVIEDEPRFSDLNQTGKNLYQFIQDNISEKSPKMISFEQYLVSKGPEDCPHLLLNSLKFWIEVHKFQIICKGSASYNLLARKVGALVDCYLDTTTPPWVKITVTNDIAHRLTDISTSIMTTPDYNTLEEASDLLAKTQSEILSNLIEPWVEFDKTYKSTTSSPTHSSITTRSSASGKSSTRSLPLSFPSFEEDRRLSLLSYSRKDGLQWLNSTPETWITM